jgi:transposase InsO family protein
MREAAVRPVIVPDQVVIDHGKVFVSDAFTRACERLGISIQPARKDTPTDKAVVEATFSAIKTLFAQHVAGFKGANTQQRGRAVAAEWTLEELQDLLDEWLIDHFTDRRCPDCTSDLRRCVAYMSVMGASRRSWSPVGVIL